MRGVGRLGGTRRPAEVVAVVVVSVLLLSGVVLALVVGLSPAHGASPAAASHPAKVAGAAGRPVATTTTTTTTTAPPSSPPTTSAAPPSSAPGAGGTAPTVAPTPATTVPPPPIGGPVSAVGDSIMIDIQPYLEQDIPGVRVDGLVSRQFEAGIAVVQAERAAGTLGNVLVVELGTNGTVTPADIDQMMAAASGVTRVVFVDVCVDRPWAAPNNAALAAGVARYPDVAMLVDWCSAASGHPEWFTPDGVHLQPAGAQALAALITRYA